MFIYDSLLVSFVVLVVLNKYNVSSSFGCAETVISDQGREFVNSLSEQLFKFTGTKHNITRAYHPRRPC